MNYIIKISELPRNKICYKLNIWPCTFTKDFPCITEPAIKKYLIKINNSKGLLIFVKKLIKYFVFYIWCSIALLQSSLLAYSEVDDQRSGSKPYYNYPNKLIFKIFLNTNFI